ncbi:conserved hypothetical protein [Ricinus communis]|uniref:DUF1421 domain-containing protein n=1 Tax=Ricinus communis TaxID=3988 RepID=B9RAX3_RICCO|nr:conserved hypothetical protein [Ricinus communis]
MFWMLLDILNCFKSWLANNIQGWSSMDHIASNKLSDNEVGTSSNAELISRIDQKLKEHIDILLHSVEYLSARVSQMETRVRQVEISFDGLKESIEFNHGKTDGKLWELENILTEVHGGIKDLRDKQEISEAQVQMAKLQVCKDAQQLEKQNSIVQLSSHTEASSSVSQQSNQPLAIPVVCPQLALAFSSSMSNMPLQNHCPTTPAAPRLATPSASHLHIVAATAPQVPTQLPQNAIPSVSQQEPYYQLPISTPGTSHQQYVPPTQQSQQSLHLHQPYQPPPHLPLNSHPPQLHQVRLPITVVDPRVNSYHPEELPYAPSHGIQKPSQLHDRPHPPQVFDVGSTHRTHGCQPSNFFDSESASANLRGQGLQPRGYDNTGDYYYMPTHSGTSTLKPLQPSLSPPVTTDDLNYSRLPTARTLPHAIPTASAVDGGSSSGGSGNRVPVDDVVDKVVGMGFRRDTVRATVKKLTENGQSVDLNVVLDKLMNNG